MKTENRISSAVSDIGSEAAERFDEVQSNVTETVARISRQTGEFIRERPWTAVAIVAAIGIAIGLLAKNRTRRTALSAAGAGIAAAVLRSAGGVVFAFGFARVSNFHAIANERLRLFDRNLGARFDEFEEV